MAPDLNTPSGSSAGASDEAIVKVRGKDTNKREEENDEDLSEEDFALKQQLLLYLERVQDPEPGIQKSALDGLMQEIRTSYTCSMNSVPKPLKFLRPHYGKLKAYYETMSNTDLQMYLADILSVLALTMSAEEERESLKYRLLGSKSDIGSWGHVYVRNLAGEITQEYAEGQAINRSREREEEPVADLVKEIVAFYMMNNAEIEAVDLIMEVECLDLLSPHLHSTNFKSVCLYLTSVARYIPGPNDRTVLRYVFSTYMIFEEYSSALRIALFLDELMFVKEVFDSCGDMSRKKQFSYILARHGITLDLDEEVAAEDTERFILMDIINNTRLSEWYLFLARDMEVMEPKSSEDIYKAHSLHGWVGAGASSDSALQTLAATFVNAFVNAGFGGDKLIMVATNGVSPGTRTYLNTHGMASAVASVGMILLWDLESGLDKLKKYMQDCDPGVCAGAILGVGIVNCNIKHEHDPTFELLVLEDVDVNDIYDDTIRFGSVMGVGLAYAGTQNRMIWGPISCILKDKSSAPDLRAFAAISLGLVCLGSCNEELTEAIAHALMERRAYEFPDRLARFLPLGLGLLYLGKQERVEEIITRIRGNFNQEISRYCEMTLISCAYAGTGDVLKVQYLLRHCYSPHEEGRTHYGPAVLGIAMVAMGEEVGLEMAIRSMEHLLLSDERNIRLAVPLALGLLCISNPKGNVMVTLSRLTHDNDSEVAMAAVISLGLVGAGTNNVRIADTLLKLSSYYHDDDRLLFSVRIAQGLLHMGKGLFTLDPYHSDRFLFSPTALAGLIIVLHACLLTDYISACQYHYIFYFLVLAMKPRMLMTVDENLEPLSVPVHVGEAVDVVGRAGRHKSVTDFQTFSTPVILPAGHRAELATDEYIPLSPILEGFVILKERPKHAEDPEVSTREHE